MRVGLSDGIEHSTSHDAATYPHYLPCFSLPHQPPRGIDCIPSLEKKIPLSPRSSSLPFFSQAQNTLVKHHDISQNGLRNPLHHQRSSPPQATHCSAQSSICSHFYVVQDQPRAVATKAVAKANGLELNVSLVEAGKPTAEHLKAHPLGKFPAFLGEDGFALSESIAIAIYGMYTPPTSDVFFSSTSFPTDWLLAASLQHDDCILVIPV